MTDDRSGPRVERRAGDGESNGRWRFDMRVFRGLLVVMVAAVIAPPTVQAFLDLLWWIRR